MDVFPQCPECSREYNDPLNRRHYSQTNSCPACGINMYHGEEEVEVEFVVKQLELGKILAVKGIGGFLLITDASNADSIKTLRRRKYRPTKPFAVMYPNLEIVTHEYHISNSAKQLLENEVSPVVLLSPKAQPSIQVDSIAPGLNKVGVMIPYAPLFQLILDRFKNPIIATSGNVSGSPIIYTNEDAENELGEIADVIITNNRDIVIPQDDSVYSFTANEQPIILRRSRGMAPSFLRHNLELPDIPVLAMGADMKSAFAMTHKDYLYVSQYLGDMDSFLTQAYYEKTLAHLSSVLDHQPQVIVVDKHPGYFSTGLGEKISNDKSISKLEVQHHKAHFYAVLAENDLLRTEQAVMGIIWDGTGYGDDGMIWGGEFLTYRGTEMSRVSHLPYFPFILGDKMPREPRISALAISNLLGEKTPEIHSKFNNTEWQLYQPMLAEPTLQTSSMGRLFDAVASLVLGTDKISFEGEAAMMLEAAAQSAFEKENGNRVSSNNSYDYPLDNFQLNLFNSILDDIKSGTSNPEIALKFHYSLVNLIRQEAEKLQVRKLAFSGGVFQNSLLVALILKELSSSFDLYFHKQLSPNDENISYGQIAWYTMHEKQLDK
jgi:hydrogenase maturation protein HypF